MCVRQRLPCNAIPRCLPITAFKLALRIIKRSIVSFLCLTPQRFRNDSLLLLQQGRVQRMRFDLQGAPEFLAGIHQRVAAQVGDRGYAVVLETLRDGDCMASAHAQVLHNVR